MLPPDHNRMIKQAKFTYSPPSKVFEKQIKIIAHQREKQVNSLEEHGKQLVKSSGEKDSLKLFFKKRNIWWTY